MSAACAHKLLFVCLRNGNGLEQGTGRRRYAWPAVCRRPNKHCIELVRTSLSTSTSRSKERMLYGQLKLNGLLEDTDSSKLKDFFFFLSDSIIFRKLPWPSNYKHHATSIFKVRRQSSIVSLV